MTSVGRMIVTILFMLSCFVAYVIGEEIAEEDEKIKERKRKIEILKKIIERYRDEIH